VEQLQEGSKFTFLYGVKKIELKLPVITEASVKRKYWFGYKTVYYVDWECCRIGPITLEEAEEQIAVIYKCS
jgi:hypothetical protein